MEVIEDGNIMDRIPILLQRDIEYYEKNHTVLSESVCRGVVGGRLDFPRNASFAAVKIVLWLEDEFSIAFNQGSGMFVTKEEDKVTDGVAKTSDPDKFVQLAVKSADLLLEHLHMLAQEALDHADLPVLTATLGAAALLKNSLLCYLQHSQDRAGAQPHAALQACYKRYATMAEAVGERVLDLHCRVLSLYVLQDAARPPGAGAPSVQGWWLYMNGSRKDLWDTVPPRMAQRIFAGMLNETLTILTVRYCQSTAPESETPALINDILNILQCTARLLPGVCSSGAELAGQATARHVRDVHAKCDELFNCLVYRGAELHFIRQAFQEPAPALPADTAAPWFAFASPELFPGLVAEPLGALPLGPAVGLELLVLLAAPQPAWRALLQVIMMRDCHLARLLLARACRGEPAGVGGWGRGRWLGAGHCPGVLCTADGYCGPRGPASEEEEMSRAAGALTYVLASVGSRAELQSTLCGALEMCGRDWAACLDKRQVWCDRRPAWLAGILALIGSALEYLPPILVRAVQTGASMYQTMSLALTCIARSLGCVPRAFFTACGAVQAALPGSARPAGGSVALQALVAVAYDEMLEWARIEALKEAAVAAEANGGPAQSSSTRKTKHVRIAGLGQTNPSSSFDGTHSSPSAVALAVAEAMCSLDEDHKHTRQIEQLVALTETRPKVSSRFGLDEFPEFADFFEEGSVGAAGAERASDADVATSRVLMTAPGRDSLRVIYEHLQTHAGVIFEALGLAGATPPPRAPLLYTMFHVGREPFDQYLRGECPIPWSKLVRAARARGAAGGAGGARAHVLRRRPRDPALLHLLRSTDTGL